MVEDVGRRPATVAEARRDVRYQEDVVAAASGGHCGDGMTSQMPGALHGLRILDLTRLLPGGFCTLLLADMGAEVLKVEDTGGGDYIRWMPPYYGGEEEQKAGVASAYYLALNRNKRSMRLDLKDERGRDVLLRLVETYDVLVEGFRPGRDGAPRRRLRDAARAEPAPDLLRDLRLWPGRPADGALGSRHQLPRAQRPARPDRAPRRTPGPVRRSDRGSRRRRVDGGGGDPGGGRGARTLRRGPDGRHLDDRRRAVVARDGGGALLRRGQRAAPRGARADGRHRLLRPVRDEGRQVGVAGRARAEVLAELVQRCRASGPDREAVRPPRLRGRRRDRRGVPGAHARRVDRVCGRARLLPRADPRPRRGTRLGARPRARHGRRARPARHRCGEAGRRADQAFPHAGRHERRRACARRRHRRRPARDRHRSGARCAKRELREGQRPDADGRAGRGRGRVGRHDQALPARGPAPRAGEDVAQHGLVSRASSSSACSRSSSSRRSASCR